MTRFESKVVRYPLRLRTVTVAEVTPVAPTMVRLTCRGEDLEDFRAPAPSDHVKMFFPDADGTLATPVVTEDGIRPPETGTVLARDYTPLAIRTGEHGVEVDFDFVLHGDDGPASAWAARVRPGDTLTFAGPRGSHLVPEGIGAAIIVADETGLPAARRWFEELAPRVPVTGLFTVADPGTTSYLDDVAGGERSWFSGPGRDQELEQALRSLAITDGTFIFLAGESGAIVPLRRYLRRELGLPPEQVDAHGYWKRGVVNLDHHQPLDPDDAT